MGNISSKINARIYTNSFMLVYLVLHFILLRYIYHISLWSSLYDTISTGLLIFILIYVLNVWKRNNAEGLIQILKLIFLNLLISGVLVFVFHLSVEAYFNKDYAYVDFVALSLQVRGLVFWILLCHFTTIQYIISDQIREQEQKERTLYNEQLKKDAELFKLRQQINPHFLFNTLNSINALVTIAPDRSRNMIQQLSQYFRNTIKKEDHQWVSVEEEMKDIRLYFEIEKVRFGHRLHFHEEIEERCLPHRIPPFLIQPLVENAIKYGLYGTTGEVLIDYQLYITTTDRGNEYLIFSISNPFDSSTPQVGGTGFGLKSIERRLYLLFARNDLLLTRVAPSADQPDIRIFTAYISIPISSNPLNSEIHDQDHTHR